MHVYAKNRVVWKKKIEESVQPGTSPVPPGLQGVNVGQQGMFMGQGMGAGRAAGFPVGAVGNSALQGPLAFLEKTTSNIGMPERRS
ncbi:hypothetical protein PV326_008695 [Microctonus aethiopoides]|nr:hypothetical protein PV326_008695 [Microctonus aethiopoides]